MITRYLALTYYFDDPANPPTPAPARAPLVCEFCECELTPAGDVKKFSAKSRAWRDLDESAARERAKLQAQIDQLTTENAALKTQPATSSRY
jgi:hypothetical protein